MTKRTKLIILAAILATVAAVVLSHPCSRKPVPEKPVAG